MISWANIGQKRKSIFGFSSETCIENLMRLFDMTLKAIKIPMDKTHHPEIDDPLLLSDNEASKHRSVIGGMNWLITSGHFDTHSAANILSRFATVPREAEGFNGTLSHIKTFPKGRISFDTNCPALSRNCRGRCKLERNPPWCSGRIACLEPRGKKVSDLPRNGILAVLQ